MISMTHNMLNRVAYAESHGVLSGRMFQTDLLASYPPTQTDVAVATLVNLLALGLLVVDPGSTDNALIVTAAGMEFVV